MRVLVTGSTAYDVLLGYDGKFRDSLRDSDESDGLSVVYLSSHLVRHFGGAGANIAWYLRLLGHTPLSVLTVGSDGGEYLARFADAGIDTSFIERIETDVTSTAIIGSDTEENQLGYFHAGADRHGGWPDLNEHRDDIACAIISPRDENVMLQAVAWCKDFGVPYIFDPGQRITSMGNDDLIRCLEGSRALIANEYEWSVISDRLNVNEENVSLYTSLLIVTRGEAGVTYFDENGAESVQACSAERTVNPTGAGDAFRAGLLAGIASDWALLDSVRLGAAVGSFAVESEGPQLESFDIEEAYARAREAYDTDLPDLRFDK